MATDGFRVERLDHVHVMTADRVAAARWYGEMLGLFAIHDYTQHGDPDGPLVLSSDEGRTHLALFQAPAACAHAGHAHTVAFRVDGRGFLAFLDRLDRVVLRGDRARVGRGDVVDHGDSCSLYFRDLDGNPLELTTYDHQLVRGRLAGPKRQTPRA
jgi:catechol 2,3-dioxygenase-like lactoylglutathione lyase family enzyme